MWLIAFAVGCVGPEVAGFLDERALAICARHGRCETLADAGYATEGDCVAAIVASDAARADAGELACPAFDESAVAACLSAWDAACDAPPDLTPCDAVCP